MAFTQTISDITQAGNRKIVVGTYTATGVTGGDINTGLTYIASVQLQPKGSAVTNAPVVNETMPLNKDGVTIVCGNGEVGTWTAIGY